MANVQSTATVNTINLQRKKCKFCRKTSNDPLLGEKYEICDTVVHYYCLLLSNEIRQNGADDEGILGFMPADILKELDRGKNLRCKYCKRMGATITCNSRNCKHSFHLPCGLNKGSTHVYLDSFPSYCHLHPRLQKFPIRLQRDKNVTCVICIESINVRLEKRNLIWATCCRKQTVMHRLCAQQYVNNAGYEVKCPICSSRMRFTDCLLRYGVFCPQREASWEQNGGFNDLICDPVCNMSTCNAYNRIYNRYNTLWEIITCFRCLAFSTHRACGGIHLLSPTFLCAPCQAACRNELPPEPTSPDAKPCAVEYCVNSKGRYAFTPKGDWRLITCNHCTNFVAHYRCAGGTSTWYCNRFSKFPDGIPSSDDEDSISLDNGPIIHEITPDEEENSLDSEQQSPSKRARVDEDSN